MRWGLLTCGVSGIMENFSDFCKDYLFKQLDECEGVITYGCDLSYKLCEGCNIDGSLTYCRQKAIEYCISTSISGFIERFQVKLVPVMQMTRLIIGEYDI